jgi:DNA-binding NtrC family response regulator
MKHALVATSESPDFETIAGCFAEGAVVDMVSDEAKFPGQIGKHPYDIVFLDISFLESAVDKDQNVYDRMIALRESMPGCEIVVICPVDRVRDAVQVVRAGADSYLIRPVDATEVRYIVESAEESKRPPMQERPSAAKPSGFAAGTSQVAINFAGTLAEVRKKGIADIERLYVQKKLVLCKGRIDKTAQVIGISTRQLHKLMTKYKLKKEEFKEAR